MVEDCQMATVAEAPISSKIKQQLPPNLYANFVERLAILLFGATNVRIQSWLLLLLKLITPLHLCLLRRIGIRIPVPLIT
jgi:hypothetical protein